MRFTAPLLVVYKKTGGRLWNKPWGLPPLTKTQIRNRKKENNIVQQVGLESALRTVFGPWCVGLWFVEARSVFDA